MPELRKDPITGRWVVVSTERQKRPMDFRFERATAIDRAHCPFCPGREHLTPHEVLAYRNGGSADGPGWDLRVVPNKFPALRVEGTLEREGEGMFDRMSGIGAHEVVIETTDHDKGFATMSEPEIERVLWAFRDRVLDLKNDIRFRYILLFKNHGAAAGATLEHGHSQLLALPIVPDFVREEVEGARRHFKEKERCVFCDVVRQEIASGRRLIDENADVVALAPYAACVREPVADAQVRDDAHRPRARDAAVQSHHPQRAVFRRHVGFFSLARRDHAEGRAAGGIRVGERFLYQSDVARGSRRSAPRGTASVIGRVG
jgi:UDPglucose--hexose-1-phosphate uridylyltransferase